MRVSRTLIVNSLCCAIGPVLAWNIWWVLAYWPTIVAAWEDIRRCAASL